jgi:hypothetical protein
LQKETTWRVFRREAKSDFIVKIILAAVRSMKYGGSRMVARKQDRSLWQVRDDSLN